MLAAYEFVLVASVQPTHLLCCMRCTLCMRHTAVFSVHHKASITNSYCTWPSSSLFLSCLGCYQSTNLNPPLGTANPNLKTANNSRKVP